MPRDSFLAYDPTSKQQLWTQATPIPEDVWQKERDGLYGVFLSKGRNLVATHKHFKGTREDFQPTYVEDVWSKSAIIH